MRVSFYDSFPAAARDAILDGLGAWNFYFANAGVDGGYSVVGDNAQFAEVGIYLDYTLQGTAAMALGSFGPGHIRFNPDYLGNLPALTSVALHEAGHNFCFQDKPGCVGHTVMADHLDSQSGPFFTALYACDTASLATVYPPPSGGEDPHDGEVWECSESNCIDPIVFNLGRGPYQLTGLDDPVQFDMYGTGHPLTVSWTAAGQAMAFLTLDRNDNGVVDDGRELFGNATLLSGGTTARHGFEALSEYDLNGDRQITSDDRVWSSLTLWTDFNHDGMSQPDELQSINDSTVTAIQLSYRRVGRQDRHGNRFRYMAHLDADGKRRPYYDIFFRVLR